MNQRILLLTGPAGTGKTTSVKVIANEMGVDLVEWGEGVEEWSLGSGIGVFCVLTPVRLELIVVLRSRISHEQIIDISRSTFIRSSLIILPSCLIPTNDLSTSNPSPRFPSQCLSLPHSRCIPSRFTRVLSEFLISFVSVDHRTFKCWIRWAGRGELDRQGKRRKRRCSGDCRQASERWSMVSRSRVSPA